MCFEIKKFFFSAIEGLYQHALWKRCGSLTQIVCLLQKKFLFVFLTSFSNSQRNLIFSLQPEKLNFYSPPPKYMLLPLLFLLMILFVPVIMLLLQPLMLSLETNSVVVSTFVVYFLVIKKLHNVKRLCIVVKTEWQNINKVKYLT